MVVTIGQALIYSLLTALYCRTATSPSTAVYKVTGSTLLSKFTNRKPEKQEDLPYKNWEKNLSVCAKKTQSQLYRQLSSLVQEKEPTFMLFQKYG